MPVTLWVSVQPAVPRIHPCRALSWCAILQPCYPSVRAVIFLYICVRLGGWKQVDLWSSACTHPTPQFNFGEWRTKHWPCNFNGKVPLSSDRVIYHVWVGTANQRQWICPQSAPVFIPKIDVLFRCSSQILAEIVAEKWPLLLLKTEKRPKLDSRVKLVKF